jgi:leucyl-tRNA---protein transferase
MNIDEINFSINGICPYLKDRYWSLLTMEASSITAREYEKLLNIGYRKNGNIYYLPKCHDCEECRSLRVIVNKFRPSKRNRKLIKNNNDIIIKKQKPTLTNEKIDLYAKYIANKHNDKLTFDVEQNYRFSFLTANDYTQEMEYYLHGKLIGVGIIEVLVNTVSSVYFYYDTKYMDRSLGIYSILKEIEFTQQLGKKYLHLGYYIHECSAMNYKSRFKPNDILYMNNLWINGESFISKFHFNKKKDMLIDDLWFF